MNKNMIYHKSNALLKAEARDVLLGKLRPAVIAIALTILIRFALSEMNSSFAFDNRLLKLAFIMLLQFITVIVAGLFEIGLCALFLNLQFAPESASIRDLFAVFRSGYADTAIRIRAFFSLFDVVFYLPSVILSLWLPDRDFLHYSLPVYAAVGAAVVLRLLFSICFGISSYLFLDYPEMTAVENLRRTWLLMKGSRGRYLRLFLSFVPLYLLSALSLGIASLWVSAYLNAARVSFYKDLLLTERTLPAL